MLISSPHYALIAIRYVSIHLRMLNAKYHINFNTYLVLSVAIVIGYVKVEYQEIIIY